jgi:hypothetical protein
LESSAYLPPIESKKEPLLPEIYEPAQAQGAVRTGSAQSSAKQQRPAGWITLTRNAARADKIIARRKRTMSKVGHLKEPVQHSGKQTAAGTRKYLYALIAQGPEREFGPCGIDGGVVYTIAKGRIAAVVSDLPGEKIRPERRNLAAHQQILQRLLETSTPLPTAFGVIAPSARTVEKILSANQEIFLEQLRRLEGRVEMGLRVAWDVPNIFEYFINTHSELKAARDSLLGRQREPTQEERIEVGRLFDRTLQEDREAYADQLEGILSAHCDEIKRNKCRDEREVMNLACLVGKQVLKDFEAGVFEAAQLFDNNFSFNYNGPWAPHNFVSIALNL